jgi:hypothetical protein
MISVVVIFCYSLAEGFLWIGHNVTDTASVPAAKVLLKFLNCYFKGCEVMGPSLEADLKGKMHMLT